MHVIARLPDLPDGGITKARLGETDIILVRDGDTVNAFAATCPHAGAPLAEGALCRGRLICPWHKANFRVTDGAVLEPPALDALTRYPTRIEGDAVLASAEAVAPAVIPGRRDGRVALILGSGAGGTAAAVRLRDLGYPGRVVLVGHEALEPYDRTVLSKFVLEGGMAPADVPPLRDSGYWAGHDIERVDATITRVDAAGRKVHLADGTVLGYDAAVLATGAVPLLPELHGVTLEGVHVLRNRQDAAAILADAPPGAHAVIVGSSFIGLEAASALRKRGVQVTVAAPEDIPFRKQFGPEIGAMFRRLHEANGVTFRLGCKLREIEGKERALGVGLNNGDRLAADVVILGVGVSPATENVDGVRKAGDGGILVDATMKAANGFYVVGDSACFPLHGGQARIEHWRLAQQHAWVAASNIAGVPASYQSVPFFWTYHYGKRFEYIGHAMKWDTLHVDGDLDTQRFVALQVLGDDVVGVVACQREHLAAVLSDRMRDGLRLSEAKRLLSK